MQQCKGSVHGESRYSSVKEVFMGSPNAAV